MTGAVKNPLPLDYVSQEDEFTHCGPASVKMLLSRVKPTAESLTDIYKDTHVADPGWSASGDPPPGSTALGVEQAISSRAGHALQAGYTVQLANDRALFTRRLCWAVEARQQTPIVLVHATSHWVVVNGFILDVEGGSVADSGTKLKYVSICDPGHRFDDCDIDVQEVVTRQDWESLYLCTPFQSTGGHTTSYDGNYVALHDDVKITLPVEEAVVDLGSHEACDGCSAKVADDLLDSEALFRRAPWSGLRGHLIPQEPQVITETGVLRRKVCQMVYEAVDPRNGRASGRNVLKVRYGCNDGAFLAALATFGLGKLAARDRSLDGKSAAETIELLNRHGITVEETGKRYRPSTEDPGPLYWRSGYVSSTPFLPFYRMTAHEIGLDGRDVFTSDGHRVEVELFVRVDLRGFLVRPDSDEDRESGRAR